MDVIRCRLAAIKVDEGLDEGLRGHILGGCGISKEDETKR